MVVVMEERASEEQIQNIIAQLVDKGFDVHRSTGALRTVLGAVGGNRGFDKRLIEVMDGVHEVLRITEPYKLASRTFKPERTFVNFDDFPRRRRRGHRHGRTVLGRERRAGRHSGRQRATRRREDPAGRRVQTPELAVQLPGAG